MNCWFIIPRSWQRSLLLWNSLKPFFIWLERWTPVSLHLHNDGRFVHVCLHTWIAHRFRHFILAYWYLFPKSVTTPYQVQVEALLSSGLTARTFGLSIGTVHSSILRHPCPRSNRLQDPNAEKGPSQKLVHGLPRKEMPSLYSFQAFYYIIYCKRNIRKDSVRSLLFILFCFRCKLVMTVRVSLNCSWKRLFRERWTSKNWMSKSWRHWGTCPWKRKARRCQY
jgi:hypothetical protein